MSVAFEAAWMLLKQRGHELNLPKPVRQDIGPYESDMSPQDLIDARVDAASKQRHALNVIETEGTQNPRINSMDDAMGFLDDHAFNERQMRDQLNIAQDHQNEEAYYQGEQGALDRATLARRAQQPEADEMEAMGVPPMSRTMGGTPPANIGRAGSTGEIPRGRQSNMEQMGGFGMDDVDDARMDLELNDDASPAQRQQLIDRINQNIKPFNPFPKPLAGRVQDQLAEFADTAGRRAAMSPQTDYSDADDPHNEEMDAKLAPFVGKPPKNGISDPHPEAHNIASTNIRETPRKTKRGQIDEPRATPRMQGRAARSPSPFVGGQ